MDQSLESIVFFRTPGTFDSIDFFSHGRKEKTKTQLLGIGENIGRFGRGDFNGGLEIWGIYKRVGKGYWKRR